MNGFRNIITSTKIDMKLKENSDYNKLHGIYYTPKEMASSLVEQFLVHRKYNNILEPSCGEGIFIDELINHNVVFNNICAVEIESEPIKKINRKYSNDERFNVSCVDFFDFYKNHKNKKYDLVLGNPPYIRYQYLTPHQRKDLSDILSLQGMKPNKLINAWVAFTVACSSMINEDGILAFVVPAEILQVVYAKELRFFLSKVFNEINIVAFDQLTFKEIDQEVVLLVCCKSKEKKGLRIVQVKDVSELKKANLNDYPFQKLGNDTDKWTKYFNKNDDVALIENIKNNKNFQKLSDVALINVGITTGNNGYFSINKDINEKYRLQDFCIPLLGKSCQIKSLFFTRKDLENNYQKGKKSYLLVIDAQDRKYLPKNVIDYIEYGEHTGANIGYKCSIRDYWYSIPSVWIPDAFFSRRNNECAKLVLNKCGAVSTDTMHRLKFLNNTKPEQIILSYYNSVSFAFAEISGRSYGGGVLEILPSEVGNIYIPIVSKMSEQDIKNALKKIDDMLRKNAPLSAILDFGDKILLQEEVGMSEEECKTFRKMWIKLKNRRLGRSKKL